uniref:Ectonucleoside triphosphate diphosphohydrolase 2b n=1 Tax=Sinocyclocheilus rhinocerous TaxID=307959 RepID=A0A673LT66_9TELE
MQLQICTTIALQFWLLFCLFLVWNRIVLDAGSSHTSMFIYKCQHSECHVSSYAGNRGGAARSLFSQIFFIFITFLNVHCYNNNKLYNNAVLKEVRDKLKTYPFSFKGAYGWVTVNYLLEKFTKYSFVGQWLSPGRDTVGALDFGGASTQITFETKQTVENKDNLMKLRLYGRDYQIYTQSFLCYGRDQVLLRLLALLMKVKFHPCYPASHSDSIKLSSVFDTPCNKRQTPYKPDDDLCSFDGVFQPNITGNFMAFSAFFYTHLFLQKAAGITITSPAHLEDAVRVVCNMSFQEVNLISRDHLREYCADSILLQVLLITGYGFSDLSFPHISFQEKAADTSVSWSLGYMLSLSNLLPAENVFVRKTLRLDSWRAALFLFSALLIKGKLEITSYDPFKLPCTSSTS